MNRLIPLVCANLGLALPLGAGGCAGDLTPEEQQQLWRERTGETGGASSSGASSTTTAMTDSTTVGAAGSTTTGMGGSTTGAAGSTTGAAGSMTTGAAGSMTTGAAGSMTTGSTTTGAPTTGAGGSGGGPVIDTCVMTSMKSCQQDSCHGGALVNAGLNLENMTIIQNYKALVDRPNQGTATGCMPNTYKLIDSSNAMNSLIYMKITAPMCGAQMPIGVLLSGTDKTCILSWINSVIAASKAP